MTYTNFRQRGGHGGHGVGRSTKPRGDGLSCATWKAAYATWDDAEAACLRLYVETGTVTFAYRCEACGRWHGSKFAPRARGGPTGSYEARYRRMRAERGGA